MDVDDQIGEAHGFMLSEGCRIQKSLSRFITVSPSPNKQAQKGRQLLKFRAFSSSFSFYPPPPKTAKTQADNHSS